MAVFLINICKFNGCGITFPSLGDLIQHIEDTHIDYDPKVVEQKEQAQPACLPLSYVLRFISEDARKESPFLSTNAAGVELKRKLAIKHHSYSMSSSNRSNTPTGSEMDEDEMVVSESEDSNESWTTEEFSSEFIMRYGSRHSGTGSNGTPGNEKPFACPVPGCKKRYKNVNGIKYHSKNGHKKDGKVRKGYKCHCGKSYKTAQGLKSHALLAHNTSPESVLTTQQVANIGNNSSGGLVMQRSSSPSQSLGSLSPSSISNMSSSASSCHGGSSNTHTSSSMLQQLTNASVVANVSGGISNGGSGLIATTNNVNAGVSVHHQQQQTQQQQHQHPHQQQFNSTASSNHQLHGLAAVGSEANATSSSSFSGHLLSASSSIASNTAPNNAGNASNSRVPSLVGTSVPPLTMTVTPPLCVPLPNAANAAPPTTYNSSPIISPTFIEHKYSANIFKEKFLANLRMNQGNSHKSSNKKALNNNTRPNGKSLEDCADAGGSNQYGSNSGRAASPGVGITAGGTVVHSVDELCSMQQQLNENYNKSNLYQKTIN